MELFSLSDWSIWGLIAIGLVIVEMLTTIYVALGFGLSAALVAVIVYLVPGLHAAVQGLIWAVLGLVIWLGLSRLNRNRHATRRDINDFDSLDSLTPEERARRRQEPKD